jgi:hypothetical protein
VNVLWMRKWSDLSCQGRLGDAFGGRLGGAVLVHEERFSRRGFFASKKPAPKKPQILSKSTALRNPGGQD